MNTATVWLFAMVVGLVMLFGGLGAHLGDVVILSGLAVYLLSFIAFHFFLGKAASSMGKSWVYFGLLPVLWPVLGGLISYGILQIKAAP